MSKQLVTSIVAAVVVVAAGAAALAGWFWAAVIGLVLGAAALASNAVDRRRAGPARDIDPDLAPVLRAERDREGDLAAVRSLRAHRPDLSLADAARWVRRL